MIDDKPPKTYVHLHLKLKKMQMEEERLTIIERDNRILLEKMCHIMLTRGSVDNRNFYDGKRWEGREREREREREGSIDMDNGILDRMCRIMLTRGSADNKNFYDGKR